MHGANRIISKTTKLSFLFVLASLAAAGQFACSGKPVVVVGDSGSSVVGGGGGSGGGGGGSGATPQCSSVSDLQVISLATGEQHTCALTAAGGVRCWGDSQQGRLGDGNCPQGPVTPVQVTR